MSALINITVTKLNFLGQFFFVYRFLQITDCCQIYDLRFICLVFMEEECKRLKQKIPSNIKNKIEVCLNEAENERIEILLKQRILNLLPLSKKNNYPSFFPDKNEFYRFISQSDEILKDSIAPKHSQFLSKMYDFFLHNPIELVNVVLHVEKNEAQLLPFFAYSIIPSFFGYFSCLEHLSFAFNFYCVLISKASENIIFYFLEPFFCNSLTHKFIEILTNDTIQFFFSDNRLSNHTNKKMFSSLIVTHANNFFDKVVSYLKFLPDFHIKLLQLMHNSSKSHSSHLNSKNSCIFFITKFVVPQILKYVSYLSFHLFFEEFNMMINVLINNLTDDMIKQFFQQNSQIEFFSVSTSFDIPSINFVTTPLDGSIFFENAKAVVSIPKLILMLHHQKFSGRHQSYAPLIIKVFPKNQIAKLYPFSWRNLIFDQTNPLEKPKIEIPHFQHKYNSIKIIAKEKNTDPLNIINGFGLSSNLINSLKNQKDFDLSGLCKNCYSLTIKEGMLKQDNLCEKCKKMMMNRQPITFYDYALTFFYFKLQKQSFLFEKFIIHKFTLFQLKKLNDVINQYFEYEIFQINYEILNDYFSKVPIKDILRVSKPTNNPINKGNICKINQKAFSIIVFNDLIPLIGTRDSQKLFYCLRTQKMINFFKSNIPNFNQKVKKLDNIWNKIKGLLESDKYIIQISNKNTLLTFHAFSYMSYTINMIGSIPFYQRYFCILNFLKNYKNFYKIFNFSSPMMIYLKPYIDSCFMLSVLEISAMLMKMPEFLTLCSKNETIMWYSLEEEIQNIRNKFSEFDLAYTELHDFILHLLCTIDS